MRLNQIVRITSDFKGGLVRSSIRQYPTGDFLLSSHYVSAWKSTDTVRRESLLVTPESVVEHLSTTLSATEILMNCIL